MSRAEQIEAGKLWQVYIPDDRGVEPLKSEILFEGCKSGAMAYIGQNFGFREWKRGNVRIAKLIWEAQ